MDNEFGQGDKCHGENYITTHYGKRWNLPSRGECIIRKRFWNFGIHSQCRLTDCPVDNPKYRGYDKSPEYKATALRMCTSGLHPLDDHNYLCGDPEEIKDFKQRLKHE